MLKGRLKNNLNQLSNKNKSQGVSLSYSNNYQVWSHSKAANNCLQRPGKQNKCVNQAGGDTVGTCGACPELENMWSANCRHVQLQKERKERKQKQTENKITVLVKQGQFSLGEKADQQPLQHWLLDPRGSYTKIGLERHLWGQVEIWSHL